MTPEEIKELQESEQNGANWFNAYQDIDNFLFTELYKVGKEFPIIDQDNPQINTIEAIKLLLNWA